MSYEDVLGLMIGLGALMAVIGYLADVYFHPECFRWLELPRSSKTEVTTFVKAPSAHQNAA